MGVLNVVLNAREARLHQSDGVSGRDQVRDHASVHDVNFTCRLGVAADQHQSLRSNATARHTTLVYYPDVAVPQLLYSSNSEPGLLFWSHQRRNVHPVQSTTIDHLSYFLE